MTAVRHDITSSTGGGCAAARKLPAVAVAFHPTERYASSPAAMLHTSRHLWPRLQPSPACCTVAPADCRTLSSPHRPPGTRIHGEPAPPQRHAVPLRRATDCVFTPMLRFTGAAAGAPPSPTHACSACDRPGSQSTPRALILQGWPRTAAAALHSPRASAGPSGTAWKPPPPRAAHHVGTLPNPVLCRTAQHSTLSTPGACRLITRRCGARPLAAAERSRAALLRGQSLERHPLQPILERQRRPIRAAACVPQQRLERLAGLEEAVRGPRALDGRTAGLEHRFPPCHHHRLRDPPH